MVSTRWPWFSFMCNTTMFIQPQDKTTATTGAGGQQWKGGGGGIGDQQAGLFAQSWILQSGSLSKCGGPQTALTTDVGQVQLQACGHKKGSTTGLWPQEGQLNDRRHTAYCGHITTQQAVFTHLPVRAGKVLFLSSSNYKNNKGD